MQELQAKAGLRLANKLSSRHVEFENNKMKVRLAVQVLSNSVAKALKLLKDVEYSGFEDVDATVEFLSMIDQLFDILNSRNPFAKGYVGYSLD